MILSAFSAGSAVDSVRQSKEDPMSTFPTIPSFLILAVITAVFLVLTVREDLLRKKGQ